MHSIKQYGVVPAMDSWSLLRLVQTFDKDSQDENLAAVLRAVGPTVEHVRALALDDEKIFPKALVHGDLHPFNILKGSDSQYCILDLGCMDHEQRIADLAIFLSMTCADFEDQAETRSFFEAAVRAYEQQVSLTPSERDALPILIRANYAMFALRTAELLRDDPNNAEVRQFHERGMQGLRFMQELP
jgi:Ser/Thr protein kinase RdoA (MazF antagonist)